MSSYTYVAVLLASISFFIPSSSGTSYSNATITASPSTHFQGILRSSQGVTITVPPNVTEVYTFYPGGGAKNYTTFTLTGPTTFTTVYIDGSRVEFDYSSLLSTFTVTSGATQTETMLVSVDEAHKTGYLSKGHYPWLIETTFVLTGPTVFVTQGVTAGPAVMVSPPYALQSAPAKNLDVKTTTAAPAMAPSPAVSSIQSPTVFNPKSAVISSSPPAPPVPAPSPDVQPPIPKQEPPPVLAPTTTPSLQAPIVVATPISAKGNEPSIIPTTSEQSVPPAMSPNSPNSPAPVATPPQPLTAEGQTVPVINPSKAAADTQTAVIGGPETTIGSNPVSKIPTGIIMGAPSVPAPTPQIVQPALPSNVAGEPASRLNPTAVVIGTQTAVLGGPAVTISSTPISLVPAGIVIGTSLIALPTARPLSPQLPSMIAGEPASNLNPTGVVIGTQTAVLGGPAITISSVPISVVPAGIVIGTSFVAFPTAPPLSPQLPSSIAGQPASLLNPSAVVVGTQTALLGGPAITVSSTPVVFNSAGVLVGSSLISAPTTPPLPPSQQLTVAGQSATILNPSAVVVGSQTAVLGGSVITVSSTPISLGSAGLVVGTSTITLPTAPPLAIPNLPTVLGNPISQLNPSAVVVGSQTVGINGPAIIISSTLVSLGSAGLIVGTSTIPLPTSGAAAGSPPVITIGTEAVTLLPSAIAVGGTTIIPGGAGIIVDGTLVSLGPSDLVVGTKTETFATPTGTQSAGLGGVIMSGFGQISTPSSAIGTQTNASSTPTSTLALFKGGAEKSIPRREWQMLCLGILVAVMIWC